MKHRPYHEDLDGIFTTAVPHKTKGVVSTEEATEITSIPMISELSNWGLNREIKKKKTKNKHEDTVFLVIKNIGSVNEKYTDTSRPRLYTEIIKTRATTVNDSKLCISLMYRDEGSNIHRRVVQLETRDNLSNMNAPDWPHIHFGEKYEKFTEESVKNLDFDRAVAFFSKRSNVEFTDMPEDPYDPASFKME